MRNHATTAARLALLAAALLLPAGCSPPPPRQALTSFAAAEQAAQPVTIEGIPIRDSITRSSQGAMEFTLREESSAREMKVLAAPDLIPANLGTARYATVTGTYEPVEKQFRAARIDTR
jgi:hypothetical protein